MKKMEIPKPKFDIDDLVAYRFTKTEDRADDVPVTSEIKGAGPVTHIELMKIKGSGWSVSYIANGVAMKEADMKRIVI